MKKLMAISRHTNRNGETYLFGQFGSRKKDSTMITLAYLGRNAEKAPETYIERRWRGGDIIDMGNYKQYVNVNNNPPADEAAARELFLFLSNDGDLYRQQGLPIIKNLVAKIDRGIYDRAKAVKLYGYLVENGSRKYAKEYGGTWNQMFSVPTRKLVAENFVAYFEREYKLGAFDELHAKKYQKTKGILGNPLYGGEKSISLLAKKHNTKSFFDDGAGSIGFYQNGKIFWYKWAGVGVGYVLTGTTSSPQGAKRVKVNPARAKGSYWFDVILRGKMIDSVLYGTTGTKAEMEDEVKRSLVGHDGYDPDIRVRRRPKGK